MLFTYKLCNCTIEQVTVRAAVLVQEIILVVEIVAVEAVDSIVVEIVTIEDVSFSHTILNRKIFRL